MPKSDASVDSELQDKIEEMKKERGMVN
jgi:hypothetical protein